MFYNVHDIIKIESPEKIYELDYFKTDEKLDNIDLVLGYDTSNAIYKDLLCSLSIEMGKNSYLGASELLYWSRHVLYVNLVEPLLRMMLIPKGYVLLHLACMEKDGKGIMISAPPDTGKTSCILNCLKSNYDHNRGLSLLSDDMVIAGFGACNGSNGNGSLLSFPKPFTISSHTLGSVFDIKTNLWYKIRSRVHSKGGRSAYKGIGSIDWIPIMSINALAQIVFEPPKLYPTELMKINIGKEAVPAKLYFLSNEFTGEKDISREEAVKLILSNTDNAYITPPYNKIFPKLKLNGYSYQDLIDKEVEMVSNIIKNTDPIIVGRKDYSWYKYVLEN